MEKLKNPMSKLILALSMILAVTCSANVIGPNASGIYHVDVWGAEIEAKKKEPKVSDFPMGDMKCLNVKGQIAIF